MDYGSLNRKSLGVCYLDCLEMDGQYNGPGLGVSKDLFENEFSRTDKAGLS